MGLLDLFKQSTANQTNTNNDVHSESKKLINIIKDRIITEPVLFAVPVKLADQYESEKNKCDALNIECIEGVCHSGYGTGECGGNLIYFWPNADFDKNPDVYEIMHYYDKYVIMQNIRTSDLLLQQAEGSWANGIFLPVPSNEVHIEVDRWIDELSFEASSAWAEINKNSFLDDLKICAGVRTRNPYSPNPDIIRRAEEEYNRKSGKDKIIHWQAVDSSCFEYIQVADSLPEVRIIEKGHKDNSEYPHLNDEELISKSAELVSCWQDSEIQRLAPVIPCIHKDGSFTFEGSNADNYILNLPNGAVITERNVNRVVLYRNAGDRYVIESVLPTFTVLEDRYLVNYEDIDSYVIVIFSEKEYVDDWALYHASVYYQGEKIDAFNNITNIGVYEIGSYWVESINGLKLPCGYTVNNGNVEQCYSYPGSYKMDEIEEANKRLAQIRKLGLIENGYVKIPFFVDGRKPSVACYQFCKENSDRFEEYESLIPEDNTINCMSWFKTDRYSDLEFILYCCQKSGGGVRKGSEIRKFFGNGYFGRNANTLSNYYSGVNVYTKAVLRTETDEETVRMVYELCGEPYDVDEFPETLKYSINEEDVARTLGYLLNESGGYYSSAEPKQLYVEYYDKAIEAGITKRRWYKEYELYNAVSKQFKDAVFQYRSEWLEKQSLDIYIPSLNLGIEYQGQQHYEAIDYFGGVVSHNIQVERDKRKREKCGANNVGLIYWHYDTPINKKKIIEAIEKCKECGFIEV